MNILPSLISSHQFLSPAILIYVSSAVSVLTLILEQPVSSLPLLSTLNLTTVTLSTTIFLSLKWTASSRFRTVLHVCGYGHITDLCTGSRVPDPLTHLFHKYFPPYSWFHLDCCHGVPDLQHTGVYIVWFVTCARLSWPHSQHSVLVKLCHIDRIILLLMFWPVY